MRMESIKNNKEQAKYFIIRNVVNKYLKDCFWIWENTNCDDSLLDMINKYLNSNWMLKKEYSDKIHSLLIKYENTEEKDKFDNKVENFMNLIDNHWGKSSELLDILKINNSESLNKIRYIKENSDITDEIIWIVESYIGNDEYDRFFRKLSIAESSIRLAKSSNLEKKDINLLVLVSLFQDFRNPMNKNEFYIEGKDNHIVGEKILWEITKKIDMDINKFDSLLLATKPENRGKYNDELFKIIQDANLEWFWKGPYYLLYSSLDDLEKNRILSTNFIKFEEELIKKNEKWWEFYLSNAWKNLFTSPKNSLDEIREWPEDVFPYAKGLIKHSIGFDDFEKKIDEFLEAWRLF